MIDIDMSLQAVETQKTFWVEFEIEGETEKPALEIEVKQRKQRQTLNRYIRASTGISKDQESGSTMEIMVDYYGLALALADDVINWRGFSGSFDKVKLKKWLEAFGSCAEAFAQSFKGLLENYETLMLKKKDALEKN